MMSEYSQVEINQYIDDQLKKNPKVVIAFKYGKILARKGNPGEKIITWSADKESKPIIERENSVSVDNDGNVDMIVSKADHEGKELIDSNGKNNQWIVPYKEFVKRYKRYSANPDSNIYIPVYQQNYFMEIKDDICFNIGNSAQTIAKGGFLNITSIIKKEENVNIYGVSKRDFCDTYQIESEYTSET